MQDPDKDHWIRRADPGDPPEFTGERFVPGITGEIEAEHVARYLFAAALCKGKSVLDIACGEGYGSAMLSQVASEVVGVDIDPGTVEHATKIYGGDGLRFEVGSCEQIPAKRHSFDAVVSFETIEHIGDHARFLREVRRVLRPGGVFVCSTPDKSVYLAGQEPNPFHKKELTGAEFERLLSARFEHAAFFAQRLVCGSVIARDARNRTELVRTADGRSFTRAGPGDEATYLIAVCSDGKLPRAPDQILSDQRYSIGRVTSLAQAKARLETETRALEARAHAASERAERAEATLARLESDRDRAAAARDAAESERARLAEDRGRLVAERQAAETERDAAIRDLASAQVDYQRAAAELDAVRTALIEAREKAAAAQAGLAATKSESETLRRAAREAIDGRDAARESQKRAEIHAARIEERRNALESERDALRAERDSLRAESERHAGESAAHRSRADRAEARAADAARLREELAWTLATRSWRWSKPLRSLSGAVRASRVRAVGGAARIARLLRLPGVARLTTARRAMLIRGSRLFDAGYYLRHNPDVRVAGVDPAWHFAARGGFEGRRPSDHFDTAWYLASNPDVAEAGVHPFEHFITQGIAEGRAPLPPSDAHARPRALLPAANPGPLPGQDAAANSGPSELLATIEVRQPPPAVEIDPAQRARTKVLAFYLPQFHPIPENDAWWGKGFTEWANVTRARPMFEGHAQPVLPGELGFYDLRLPEARQRQAELARAAGIHGFCYHHYWFNGRRVLERPLDEVLASGSPDFPFCVCWANENWTRRWDGLEQEILLRQRHTLASDRRFILDLIPYLEDPRYVRVDGRPVVLIYRADLMVDAADTAAVWRDECLRAGLGEIHLCAVQFRTTDPRPLGFDAAVEFPPHHFPAPEITRKVRGLDPAFRGMILDYAAGVRAMIDRPLRTDYRLYRSVMPSWDNTARRLLDATIHHGASPELYEAWLRSAINQRQPDAGPDDNLVFVNAWNEWAEGTVLEPRRDLGDAYLRATARVLRPHEIAHAAASPPPPIVTTASSHAPAPPDGPPPPRLPARSPGIEDRLKRVVRTTPALNAFLARHPAIKNKAAGIVRKVAAAPEPSAAPDGSDAPARPNAMGRYTRPRAADLWRPGSKELVRDDATPILIVSHDACLAGAQIVVLELLRHFAKDPSVRVYHLLCGSGQLEAEFRTLATTCCIDDLTHLGVARRKAIQTALDALPRVKAALCNTAAVPDAVAACAERGIRTVAYLHELPTTIDAMLGGEKTVRTIEHSADRIIVVSDFVRDRLCQHYGIGPGRTEVIHMGVFPSKAAPPDRAVARRAVAAELGIDPATPLVLGCGTIHPRKGTDLWVRAAARAVRVARASGSPVPMFVWVGWDQAGPETRAWCEHDAKAAGIAGHVRFIGARQNTQPYFAAADLLALSSREDPFPLVNIEALVCATPVVAFDGAGGAPEAILDPGGDAGVVVRYADAEAMGEAITALLDDPKLRERAGHHAARIARDRLSWDRYTAALTGALLPGLSQSPRRAPAEA
ncbi:MAG: glycoside hydrolase family 99-like domain-containing protein [Phycisphaerales bacterium]|nr:glycoside hydrolase family 99-like domain-containing protein [Phycisphaerales bacterium]